MSDVDASDGRRRWIAVLAISALVLSASMISGRFGWLQTVELMLYDGFMRLRPATVSGTTRVSLLRISEEDIARHGHPFSDHLLATVLEKLTAFEPRAIGVDLYRDHAIPPGSARLEAILRANPHIIMIFKLPDEHAPRIGTLPLIEGSDRLGFSDIPIDPGGTVRRGLLFASNADRTWPSFSMRLATEFLQADGIVLEPIPDDPEGFRLGRRSWTPMSATDGGYAGIDAGGFQFLLDYRSYSSLPTFSLSQLLSGELSAEAFRDRVAIIGTLSPSVKDHFVTPYSHGRKDSSVSYGMELHGWMTSQLLRGALEGAPGIRTLPDRAEALWVGVACFAGALLGMRLRSPVGAAVVALAGAGLLASVVYAALAAGWWVPSAAPQLGWFGSLGLAAAHAVREERRDRSHLMRLFSAHVSSDVAAQLWKERHRFMASGRPRSQRLTATVLFTDLEGYTAAAERMDPALLMEWVNSYTGAMAQLIEDHGGIVDDFLGDGIKANFGVPVPRTSDAEIDADAIHAVDCALAMGEQLQQQNQAWRQRGLPVARIRAGLLTGAVVVGSVGSAQRMKYTTVGDVVNVAARLEALDKADFQSEGGERIARVLIGEETCRRVRDVFELQDLGRHALKGKRERMAVYRVLGRKKAVAAGKEA